MPAGSCAGSASPFPVVYDGPGGTTDDYGVTGFRRPSSSTAKGALSPRSSGAVNGEDERVRLQSAIDDALST